jgi:hypothetical protein
MSIKTLCLNLKRRDRAGSSLFYSRRSNLDKNPETKASLFNAQETNDLETIQGYLPVIIML